MARGVTERNPKTLDLLKVVHGDRPLVIQLGGGEPEYFAEAARISLDYGADAIDINCGCPVPKMVKRGYGAGLMKNPELIAAIVAAVKKAVSVPVFVKIRAGFSRSYPDATQVATQAQEAGADAITVHGRYRDEFFRGHSDWDVIRRVKDALSIPVIGNGDITKSDDIQAMIAQTGCDAVMIGRASLGQPWIFGIPGNTALVADESEVLINVMKRHVQLLIDHYGEQHACLRMRTILMYYTKGIPHIKPLRRQIITLTNHSEVNAILDGITALTCGSYYHHQKKESSE